MTHAPVTPVPGLPRKLIPQNVYLMTIPISWAADIPYAGNYKLSIKIPVAKRNNKDSFRKGAHPTVKCWEFNKLLN
ncbi:hypothetical protein JYU34_016993 [Plutella xylostella]|uniref:Uncharacterized protein n=1 Tax=Plutella xylostella TaxID=51655 RepID=A0ABQ7Q3Z7_PLUXY|nr:hypothetical protein JYU34_016993 [Plutella xylostella]